MTGGTSAWALDPELPRAFAQGARVQAETLGGLPTALDNPPAAVQHRDDVDTSRLRIRRTSDQIAAEAARTPLGRVAVAEGQARVICFLASRDADFVTGGQPG